MKYTTQYNDTFTVDGIEYECFFEVEPAQRGGMIDPSWDAHCYDLVITLNGAEIKPDDLDEDGFDYTELYSDIEKLINRRAQNK